jgi:hypothetical protein
VIAGAVVLALTGISHAQEQDQRQLLMTPPENAGRVWIYQGLHVAWELDLKEDMLQLVSIYLSAREQHRDKVKDLPRTLEGFQQRQEITREARASLEKMLVAALGEEKGKKAAVALGGFSFLTDNMAADIMAAQHKAMAGLFAYQENVSKAMSEARESGSWEGMRDKFGAFLMEFAKKLAEVYSQNQMSEWQAKYAPVFERLFTR